MNAIKTIDIKKKYNGKYAVNGINLEVEEGIIFGFLGKNGAGKSTLINILTGLIVDKEGEFILLGKENKIPLKEIGVLPDYASLYNNYTALEHMKYLNGVLGAKKSKKELLEVLYEVGLTEHVNKKIKNYSFGMKKKLGIAQTLINDPKLLFLDEPTSGVDANSALDLHYLIRKIASKGTTIFLTSHNLNELEKLCNEIAIMKDGKIEKKGTIKALKNEYSSTINVKIIHSRINDIGKIRNKLSFVHDIIHISENETELLVNSNNVISKVNRLYVLNEIDVYQINIFEPSLEEIFLNV